MQPNACAIKKAKDDMSQPSRPGENGDAPRRRNDLPPEVLDIIIPALQVGGLSGMSGLLVGGFAGVIRSNAPFLFALASGIQWSVLGGTFWASRGVVLHAWGKEKVTPREKASASAIAGAVGGTAGGLLRGRRNVLPGAVMFALFGATGQVLYNMADTRNSERSQALEEERDLKTSWLNSKWSPMKVLSDAEYEAMLQDKLLSINAQIALVDENIEALRNQKREVAAKKTLDDSWSSKST
ncbi:hypothetical protein ONS95_009204 [Cadophora gregata]|uniref:uncharacterized protein n=1 Tax=Cadophora gregata TaxID=51156 RepID=UPI0026DB09B0|nr:uncharacterized protein ONS95_009204 [Cadophora gregata]KAK0124228.1 hypothetical protein ONS95_009204 [Cadophora gregata]